MKQFFKVLGIVVFYIIGFFGFTGFVWGLFNQNPPDVCQTISVPFEHQNVDDSNIDKGQTQVTTTGVQGERKVCKNSANVETSNVVTKAPITEVTHVGTKEPVYQPYVAPQYEGGAICNDGWRSYSTGRGTCSHHGGIDYYL